MDGFNRADRAVLASLVRMQSPEMRPLLEFFENLAEQSKDALITASGETLQRLQGRAGLLKEFVDAVHSAHATLEKLR